MQYCNRNTCIVTLQELSLNPTMSGCFVLCLRGLRTVCKHVMFLLYSHVRLFPRPSSGFSLRALSSGSPDANFFLPSPESCLPATAHVTFTSLGQAQAVLFLLSPSLYSRRSSALIFSPRRDQEKICKKLQFCRLGGK